jgi:hypothetical protein
MSETEIPTYLKEGREPKWSLIPGHMIGGMRRYIECGIRPGDFLTAVLSNDLMEACGRADYANRHCLFNYATFLYNYAPRECFGSPERVDAWIERKGLGWPVPRDDR